MESSGNFSLDDSDGLKSSDNCGYSTFIGTNSPPQGHSPCNPNKNEIDVRLAIEDIIELIEEIENNPILDEETKEELIKYYEKCLRRVTLTLVNILIDEDRDDDAIQLLKEDSRFDMMIKGYSLLVSRDRLSDAATYLESLNPSIEEEIDYIFAQKLYLRALKDVSFSPSEFELDQLYDNGYKNTGLAGFSKSVYLYFTDEMIELPIEMEGHDEIDPRSFYVKGEKVLVYPNPIHGFEITVETEFNEDANSNSTYNFYSIEGKLLSVGDLKDGVNKLSRPRNFRSGIYFLQLTLPTGKIEVHKIISTQ